MSINQRSVLTTQNTTLSTNKDTAFPDNNNKEITAAILRTWLDELLSQVQDIIDSYFNKVDELRITSTLAFDDGSTNTDWDGDVFPAFQGLVNNQLASRTKALENSISSNPSANIAYVATNGSDTMGEFEIGNSEKPLRTINAAITAVPINGIVKVLGGSYTESIVISKEGLTLDISGCSIIGRVGFNKNNVTVLAIGATITGDTANFVLGNYSGTHSNFKVIGGNWNGVNGDSLNLSVQVTNVSIQFANFTSNKAGIANNILSKQTKISNCTFNTTISNPAVSVSSVGTDICKFENCEIKSTTSALNILNGRVKLESCEIIGANIGIAGSVSNGFTTDLIANSCKIEGTASYALRLTESCDNVQVTNSKIIGGTNCIEYSDVNRASGVNNIFQNNIYYAGSGDIFTDTTPNAGDLGTTEVLGGTFAKTPILIPTYVNVSATTLTVNGLQEVS